MNTKQTLEIQAGRDLLRKGMARQLRLDASLTLRDVAEIIGVSHTSVYLWENSSRRPLGRNLVRYARLLQELERVMRR